MALSIDLSYKKVSMHDRVEHYKRRNVLISEAPDLIAEGYSTIVRSLERRRKQEKAAKSPFLSPNPPETENPFLD